MVTRELLGFLYVVAMGLCVVARVFISDWYMGMWVVVRELIYQYFSMWLLVCCVVLVSGSI